MDDIRPTDPLPSHRHGTLKRRVFLLFGGFTLCLSVFYTALCLLVAYIVEDSVMDRLLNDEAHYLRREQQIDSSFVQPRTEAMTLYMRHNGGFQLPAPIKKQLSIAPEATEVFTPADDSHYHLKHIVFENGQEGMLVANVSPYLVVTAISKHVVVPVAIIWGVVFFICVVIAYRITVSAVSPVEQLSSELHRLQLPVEQGSGRTSSSVSFTTSTLDNEIGYLSESLEHAFNQLSCALRRESHFTRDLSHEMRTPLTIIKNSLTLIGQDQSKRDEVLNHIRDAAVTMDQTVEVLLALARKSSLNRQSFGLHRLIEDEVLQLHVSYPDCEVSMDLEAALPIEANRRLTSLLIINLLENAARYSDDRRLHIFADDDEIVFSNSVSQPVSDDITAPGIKGRASDGIGQGLYLVKRIVETLGWQYRITNSQDGYQFRLIPSVKP